MKKERLLGYLDSRYKLFREYKLFHTKELREVPFDCCFFIIFNIVLERTNEVSANVSCSFCNS